MSDMTSRELKILNIVYKLGGQCSIRTVSKKTAVSLDYTNYLSKVLMKDELVKIANGAIVLTSKGKSFLTPPKNESERELKFLGITPYLKDRVEKKLMEQPEIEQSQFISYSAVKNQTIEKIDAELIEAGIRRLTAIEPIINQKSRDYFQSQKKEQKKFLTSIKSQNRLKGRKIKNFLKNESNG